MPHSHDFASHGMAVLFIASCQPEYFRGNQFARIHRHRIFSGNCCDDGFIGALRSIYNEWKDLVEFFFLPGLTCFLSSADLFLGKPFFPGTSLSNRI